jgi:hypothetical protein
VLRKVDGPDDDQARWQPDGALIPLLGIVNHLTRVEWRWIDGGMRGAQASRSEGAGAGGKFLPPRPAGAQRAAQVVLVRRLPAAAGSMPVPLT